jgi:hypothetical protein
MIQTLGAGSPVEAGRKKDGPRIGIKQDLLGIEGVHVGWSRRWRGRLPA